MKHIEAHGWSTEYDVPFSGTPRRQVHQTTPPQSVRGHISPWNICAVAMAPEAIIVSTVVVLEFQVIATIIKVGRDLEQNKLEAPA